MRLIVCCFDSVHKAEEVRLSLLSTELDEFEDAVVAYRKPNGNLRWTSWNEPFTNKPVENRERPQSIPNLILQSSQFNSEIQIADISVNDYQSQMLIAISECISEIGIDTEFLQKISNQLKPGTSALFIVLDSAETDILAERLQSLDGYILRASVHYDERQQNSIWMDRMNSWCEKNLERQLADKGISLSPESPQNHPLPFLAWIGRLLRQ